MTDKIKELQALIETLEADSPLRKQLEEALNAELERKAEEAENAARQKQTSENADDESKENKASDDNLSDLKALNEKLEEMLKGMDEAPSTIKGKLEALMENDEFITASAGFVLGAVAVGLGTLAVHALKK